MITMRDVTAAVILLGPALVLAYDALAYLLGGSPSTITAVVRDWAARSGWPEFLFVIGAAVLYMHLFHGWPGRPGR